MYFLCYKPTVGNWPAADRQNFFESKNYSNKFKKYFSVDNNMFERHRYHFKSTCLTLKVKHLGKNC